MTRIPAGSIMKKFSIPVFAYIWKQKRWHHVCCYDPGRSDVYQRHENRRGRFFSPGLLFGGKVHSPEGRFCHARLLSAFPYLHYPGGDGLCGRGCLGISGSADRCALPVLFRLWGHGVHPGQGAQLCPQDSRGPGAEKPCSTSTQRCCCFLLCICSEEIPLHGRAFSFL